MANLIVKDFLATEYVTAKYLEERSSYEFVEYMAKRFSKMNKKIAREIAKDILSRYDIQTIITLKAEKLEPTISISYRRKINLLSNKG